ELDQGLAQDSRPAEVHHGAPGKLTFTPKATELAAFERAVSATKAALEKEAAPKRKAFQARKEKEAIERGMDPDRAEAMANRWTENVLRPGVPIVFEDEEIGTKYVWEILGDPWRYDGEVCFDPIEGTSYGRANAKFYAGNLCINCFAHGGGIFFLRHDAASVKAEIEGGDQGRSVEIFCRL